jgi:hypothetical protein
MVKKRKRQPDGFQEQVDPESNKYFLKLKNYFKIFIVF